ncbi:MAG: KR domain-containing protein, partial [Planctomycetota bacterium]|nr:KR domain-containing protein [Planctomycetota bacterium]
IAALADRLYERGVPHVRLPVARAYHSHLLDSAMPGLRAAVARVRRSRPAIPYYSGLTGALADEELTDPDYWAQQLRRPVRFARALAALDYQREPILLEVGPGQVLTDMARRALPRSSPASVLASCPNARDDQSARAFAMGVLGKLWLMGVPVDWSGLHAARPRRRVPLPTYPFERQRYWVSPAWAVASGASATVHASAGKRADIGQWFYAPSWKRLGPISPVAPSPGQAGRWLVFIDATGLGSHVSARLAGMGHEVFTVAPGERFARGPGRDYTVNPAADGDVAAVLSDLAGRGGIPANIVHLWSVAPVPGDGEEAFQAAQQAGYYSLLALGKALAGRGVTQPLTIHAFSAGAQAVCGLEELRPAAATLLGPCKVISQEYPNILCRAIDLEAIHAPVAAGDIRVEQCLAEVTGGLADRVTAWRGGYRWGQCFEQAPLPEAAADGGLRPRGVYLITGGLGGIGLVVAEQLARSVQARLVLVGRTPLPQGADREAWLASHGPEDRTVRRLQAVERMEQLGAQVMTASADAGDRAAMGRVFQAAQARFGPIHGVFHAAGVLEEWAFAPVPATGRRESEAHFGPKARGAFMLEELLRGQACDFCVLFSSISAVMGGLGYSGYAAGNAFLDAFAVGANRTTGQPRWLSVNWDIWKLPDARAPLRASLAELAITPAEGALAMLRLLWARLGGQVVVSTGDLQTRL